MPRLEAPIIIAAFSAIVLAATAHSAEITVKDGESIQKAVVSASPGDTILVHPGTYKETVYIDKDDITLRGVVVEGEWPTLEGEGYRNDAILYSGNGITIDSLKITHYKGNGVMGQAGNNFTIRNNWIIDAGVYGIFPEFGKNGLIEHNVLSKIADAAIYVGMCDNIDVRHNQVFDNVAGIEIENSRHALVESNYVHDNTGGILAFITPGLPIKTAFDIVIRDNFIVNNNHENFGAAGSIVSHIPAGTGIVVMAADDVVIENNIITGHKNVGIAIAGLDFIAGVASDPDSEPNPDRVKILDNLMWDNGEEPVAEIVALMMATNFSTKGPDIADGSEGKDSCILSPDRYRTAGLGSYGRCDPDDATDDLITYTLDEPVPAREIAAHEKGEAVYYGVCAGCHAYSVRMIGPPTMTVQALYQGRTEDLAAYIAEPKRHREDYPEMPPQDYLSEDLRLAVAEYLLQVEK